MSPKMVGSGGRVQDRCSPASSVLMVSSLLGSLRPILLKEYMRMLYTDAGCKSTMFAWLMVGEMLRVDCLKSQESVKETTISKHSLANSASCTHPSLKCQPILVTVWMPEVSSLHQQQRERRGLHNFTGTTKVPFEKALAWEKLDFPLFWAACELN